MTKNLKNDMPKYVKTRARNMKEFVLNCSEAGLSITDIENLSKINPNQYETIFSLMDKIRKSRIRIRSIRDWAKETIDFGFISKEACDNILKMKEIENNQKAEKEKNIRELWELAEQLGISKADLFKAKVDASTKTI